MDMTLHHQNFMLAVRQEMGWPLFRPVNDAIGFSSGRTMDFETGMEIGRIAQLMRKDLVYSGWTSTRALEPTGFAIAYRELLAVDIIDRLVPFASDDEAPIVFVSTRADEHFAVDGRGSLARRPGKPKSIGKGRKLAMKRITAAAAAMGYGLLENNRFVPIGADWDEPHASVETVVRFN